MTDEQLKQAVTSGFANPQHLDQLLARTDISPVRQQDVRTNLAGEVAVLSLLINQKVPLTNRFDGAL